VARRKEQKARDVRRKVRGAIAAAVRGAFPDFAAEYRGGVERSRMATHGPTLGFRLKGSLGHSVHQVPKEVDE
jgi:hypothetical protein